MLCKRLTRVAKSNKEERKQREERRKEENMRRIVILLAVVLVASMMYVAPVYAGAGDECADNADPVRCCKRKTEKPAHERKCIEKATASPST
jgi:hypothetical protein